MGIQKTGEEEINCYRSRLDDIKVNESRYFDADGDPITWENVWFCVNETEDEEQRIYAVISFAVYELEKNNISSRMVDEVEYYYYEIFVDHTFDVSFEDKNAQKDCYADLKKCYDELKKRNLL